MRGRYYIMAEGIDKTNMSLEESIKLLTDLQKKYGEYEKAVREIENNKETMSKPVEPEKRKVSAIKFFWPSFIIAPITFVVLYLVAPSLAGYGTNARYAFFYRLPYIAALAVFVIFAIRTIKNVHDLNSISKMSGNVDGSRKADLAKENFDLEHKMELLKSNLSKYDDLLPEDMRSSAALMKLKLMLQSGKATDLNDAIEKMKKG